jgi:hypothetical protein
LAIVQLLVGVRITVRVTARHGASVSCEVVEVIRYV